jgi:hypothetical protein
MDKPQRSRVKKTDQIDEKIDRRGRPAKKEEKPKRDQDARSRSRDRVVPIRKTPEEEDACQTNFRPDNLTIYSLANTLGIRDPEINILNGCVLILQRQILDTFCDDNETIQKIMEKYKKDLNGELAPFLKIIEDQKKIYELEDKKANLAELKREAANESGGLGDKKIVQENFLTAVAKLGLFLNEIDDYSYEDLDVNLEPVMYLCNLEKEILKYYARGCEGRPSYRDLDTKLYDAFNRLNGSFPTNQFNSETYMCNKPNKLYMIVSHII